MPNRSALSHEEIQELLGAHAVDAVEPEERAAIDAHLLTCDVCRTEIGRHHETLAQLVAPVEPSAGLRERILADARATGGRASTPEPDPAAALTDPAPAPVRSLDEARATRPRRSGARRGLAALAAAAAVVLVVAIGFGLGRRTSPTPDLTLLATQAQTQSGSRQVVLRSADGALDARVTQTSDGTGYLESENLPALRAGETYQLWAFSGKDGKTPISLGVLGTSPTVSTFRADTTVTGFAVSREADGGTIAPTTPVVSGSV